MRALLILLLLAACEGPQRNPDDDTTDDDDTADDDDVVDDDDGADDDDAVDDDDATGPSGDVVLAFAFELEVEDGDSSGVLRVDFVDPAAGELVCRQRLQFAGTASFGPGLVDGCAACTGVLSIDPDSVLDLTNPAVDAEDCDPNWILGSQLNYGGGMLTPRADGGFGDLLTIGLIDLDRFEALDLFVDRAGEYDAAALRAVFDAAGTSIAQIGYLQDVAGSVAAGTGIAAVAETAGPGGDDWLAAWQIYRSPAVNSYDGLDLRGAYLGRMLWNVSDSW